jgi:hypothetical protein
MTDGRNDRRREIKQYTPPVERAINKRKDDEGCLEFCNILKWSAIVEGKLPKGSLESTVRYDNVSVKVQ